MSTTDTGSNRQSKNDCSTTPWGILPFRPAPINVLQARHRGEKAEKPAPKKEHLVVGTLYSGKFLDESFLILPTGRVGIIDSDTLLGVLKGFNALTATKEYNGNFRGDFDLLDNEEIKFLQRYASHILIAQFPADYDPTPLAAAKEEVSFVDHREMLQSNLEEEKSFEEEKPVWRHRPPVGCRKGRKRQRRKKQAFLLEESAL